MHVDFDVVTGPTPLPSLPPAPNPPAPELPNPGSGEVKRATEADERRS